VTTTPNCRSCGRALELDAARRCADCAHARTRENTAFRPVVCGKRGFTELIQLPSEQHYVTTSKGIRRVDNVQPVEPPEEPSAEPAPAPEESIS